MSRMLISLTSAAASVLAVSAAPAAAAQPACAASYAQIDPYAFVQTSPAHAPIVELLAGADVNGNGTVCLKLYRGDAGTNAAWYLEGIPPFVLHDDKS